MKREHLVGSAIHYVRLDGNKPGLVKEKKRALAFEEVRERKEPGCLLLPFDLENNLPLKNNDSVSQNNKAEPSNFTFEHTSIIIPPWEPSIPLTSLYPHL